MLETSGGRHLLLSAETHKPSTCPLTWETSPDRRPTLRRVNSNLFFILFVLYTFVQSENYFTSNYRATGMIYVKGSDLGSPSCGISIIAHSSYRSHVSSPDNRDEDTAALLTLRLQEACHNVPNTYTEKLMILNISCGGLWVL